MKTLLTYISSIRILKNNDTTNITFQDILKMSAIVMLIAFFFSPPPIERLTTEFTLNDRFKAFSEQINGTYESTNYSEESHESKLTFRIIPGLIGRLSFSNHPKEQMIFLYTIQVICGFITILILLQEIYYLTNDWLYSKLITSGLMMTHLGSSFFYDTAFFLDGYAFCLMTASMFVRSKILSIAILFIAFWCDERVLLGSAGIILLRNYITTNQITLKNLLFARYNILFFVAICIYMCIRLWATFIYSAHIPLGNSAGVGITAIWEQRNHLAIAQLFTFEFYWIFLLPILTLFFKTNKKLFFLFVTYMLVSLGLTGIVYDVMRSVTYLFPTIVFGIIVYHKEVSKEESFNTALISTLINLIIPNYRYFYNFYIVLPIPFRILEMLS